MEEKKKMISLLKDLASKLKRPKKRRFKGFERVYNELLCIDTKEYDFTFSYKDDYKNIVIKPKKKD